MTLLRLKRSLRASYRESPEAFLILLGAGAIAAAFLALEFAA